MLLVCNSPEATRNVLDEFEDSGDGDRRGQRLNRMKYREGSPLLSRAERASIGDRLRELHKSASI